MELRTSLSYTSKLKYKHFGFHGSKRVEFLTWYIHFQYITTVRGNFMTQYQKIRPASTTHLKLVKIFKSLEVSKTHLVGWMTPISEEMVPTVSSYISEHPSSLLRKAAAYLKISDSSILINLKKKVGSHGSIHHIEITSGTTPRLRSTTCLLSSLYGHCWV